MIKVKVIADSQSLHNTHKSITTFELEYPRFIHAELMTHRVFSRNAASSRAIPIDKMIEMVENTPAMPVEWGINQAGMQASNVHSHSPTCEWSWLRAAKSAAKSARELQALGLHKQIVNRVLEPFQIMKTIVTATEFDNFFWLRCHKDAQPEIKLLAEMMYEAYDNSAATYLAAGEWHLPYIETKREGDGLKYYCDGKEVSLELAQMISASCCAQVSYRKLDDSPEKAKKIYDQLVNMTPVHASPFEHLATPMEQYSDDCCFHYVEEPFDDIFKGVTHLNSKSKFCSGNFVEWLQYRQFIKGNNCTNYVKENNEN